MPRSLRKSSDYGAILAGGAASPVFRADFTSNLTPQVGTAGSFSSSATRYFFDSLTSIGTKTANNALVPAFPLNGAGTSGGVYIGGNRQNLILQSEAPATTWTLVGAPTVTNGVGTFLAGGASLTYGTIVTGAVNQGIQQVVALATVSKSFVGSVFVRANTTTIVDITVEGDSGATPESTTSSFFAVTGEVRRIWVGKTFSASATGNIRLKITAQSSGVTLQVAGMQLNEVSNGTFGSQFLGPARYVKTTTVAANDSSDVLTFSGSELTGLGSQWTLSKWFSSEWTVLNSVAGNVKSLWGDSLGSFVFYAFKAGASSARLDFEFNSGTKQYSCDITDWAKNSWNHIVMSCNFSSLTFGLYLNGVAQTPAVNNVAGGTTPTWTTLQFGSTNQNRPDGTYSRVKVYNSVLTAGQVSTLYNLEKGNYGL